MKRFLTSLALLLCATLAASAQPPGRFIQVDSVAITHPPLEFEIRHRIIRSNSKSGTGSSHTSEE